MLKGTLSAMGSKAGERPVGWSCASNQTLSPAHLLLLQDGPFNKQGSARLTCTVKAKQAFNISLISAKAFTTHNLSSSVYFVRIKKLDLSLLMLFCRDKDPYMDTDLMLL